MGSKLPDPWPSLKLAFLWVTCLASPQPFLLPFCRPPPLTLSGSRLFLSCSNIFKKESSAFFWDRGCWLIYWCQESNLSFKAAFSARWALSTWSHRAGIVLRGLTMINEERNTQPWRISISNQWLNKLMCIPSVVFVAQISRCQFLKVFPLYASK